MAPTDEIEFFCAFDHDQRCDERCRWYRVGKPYEELFEECALLYRLSGIMESIG
jgi:hypothetical protein